MSAGRGLFVTATDTGVGKTVVTAGLALVLVARGHQPAVMKPVQTGNLADDPAGDTMVLERWTGLPVANVYAFEPPVAPLVAARAAGRAIELEPILERAEALARPLLVEGAGGLLVPVGEGWTIADLARELGFPLLVVARAGLGTVNHTALTIRVARAEGLEPAGVVLNEHGCPPDPSWETNAGLIEELAGVPVLGRVASIEGDLTSERLREAVERLDLAPLLARLES